MVYNINIYIYIFLTTRLARPKVCFRVASRRIRYMYYAYIEWTLSAGVVQVCCISIVRNNTYIYIRFMVKR